jgi:hypothetical protein
MSDLDKEFKELEAKVRAKMEAAAKLIAEAAQLCEDSGQKVESQTEYDEPDDDGNVPLSLYHHEMYSAVRPLMGALSAAGWSASSMRC